MDMHRAANGLRQSIEELPGSLIRHVAEPNMHREGLLKLWFGEPDVPTPQFIKDAATAALEDNQVFYAQNRGVPLLRQTISTYASALHGTDIGIDRITISGSGMNAIMMVSEALMSAGDNMVAVGPIWPNCKETVRIMDAEARQVSLRLGDDGRWQLDMDELFDACDGRTRAIFVNSPGNPTGTILERKQLQEISAWARQHACHLLVDEIYHGLHYVEDMPSILEIDQSAFVVNSFSKYFGMTGWRLGWIVVPEDYIGTANILAQNLYISASSIAQRAALAAFSEEAEGIFESRRAAFRQRRDYLAAALKDLGFVISDNIQGAFYIYANISKFSTDAEEFCRLVLEGYGVAITPGTDFGEYRSNEFVRLAFTTSMEDLELGVERLAEAVSALV